MNVLPEQYADKRALRHLARARKGALRLNALLLGVLAVQAGCSYDIDKLYEHTPGPDTLPADLIDLWKAPLISDECRECAKSECIEENLDCLDDPSCVELTQCVAKAVDPAAQNDCRAEHAEWLMQSIAARDIGGPYQQCVFLNKCTSECEGRTQLACTNDYAWPTRLGGGTVALHLRFVEGLSGKPSQGVRVRACQQEDALKCLPLTDWQTVSKDGVADIEVGLSLGAFSGYLELDGGDLYPSLLRFGWPILRELVTNVTVVSRGSVEPLLNSSVVNVDPSLGLLQLRAFGCTGLPTRGVSFSVDSPTKETAVWYTAGTDIAPNFMVDVTGDRGAGGIINVAPGARSISATSDGEEIARNVRAPVRTGYMTIVYVVPDDSTR
jgi:hypothetical protein